MDARRPRPGVPWRRPRVEKQWFEHAVERFRRDRSHAIERDRTAPLAENGGGGKVRMPCRKLECTPRSGVGRRGARLRRRFVREVDVGPLNVLVAQPVCAARPACRARRGDQIVEHGWLPRSDPEQAIRFLALGVEKVGGAVKTQHRGDILVRCRIEHARLPSEGRSRVAHRGDGVPAVMMAVAERAHPILPCLAPVDRCDTDQHATCQWRGWCFPARALLQDVIAAVVVIDAAFQTRKVGCDEIALGRMQVPAGGIAAQRPGGVAQRLPRRDRERQLKDNGNRVACERRGHGQAARPQSIETCGQAVRGKRELEARRAVVAPKRIRLVRPVEVPGPGREAAQVMLAALVVIENSAGWIHDDGPLSTTQPARVRVSWCGR